MFLLNKPSTEQIRSFIFAQQHSNFSYSQVGSSRLSNAPADYTVDHNRVRLGCGEGEFFKAQEAIRRWRMFDIEWLRLCWPDASINVGQTVAVVVRHFGLWSLNACRIVYIIDERSGETERYGFGYGTLAEHAESGEERFSVEWCRKTDEVWYDLYAFSRPNHMLAKVGYPVARWMQKEFGRESKKAMVRYVSGGAANKTLKPTASQRVYQNR